MIDLIAPGFTGDKRDLTILLVRIIFPATGLLVLSAWCLGILNSHHKFFLSYSAPVSLNGAVIAVLDFLPARTLAKPNRDLRRVGTIFRQHFAIGHSAPCPP